MSKRVVMQLPAHAEVGDVATRYAWELEALGPIGAELVEVGGSTPEEFLEGGAANADAVITSWGIRMSREIIERLERCVVIGVGSVGVDMVDVEAATDAGIVVTNTPDIFIEEVADHALMLLLASARRLGETDRMARQGEWTKARPMLSEVPRLWGQTLGIIGFGNVGVATARRARAFGFHLIAHDPYVSELKMTGEGVEPVGFIELLERSDYVSIHTPLNAGTQHLLSAAEFAAMKPTAVVVNTARGGAIDEAALVKAIETGEIAGAGLDVLEVEPPDTSNPIFSLPSVVVTPHVASATTRMRPETRRRVGREVALALSGRWPMSSVNPTVLPRVELERWQPYPMDRGPNR